jgi:hypothetical protein
MELLASPGLFERTWPRLCTGYAADAVDRKPDGSPRVEPKAVLARLLEASVEPAPAVGLGVEHRLVGEQIRGAALTVGDLVAHAVEYPVDPGQD